MKYKYPGLYKTIFLIASVVLVFPAIQAKQPERSPGVFIPVLKSPHIDDLTSTRWIKGASGGSLEVSSNLGETWDALDQALLSFGIRPVLKDAKSGEWLTDWVVWYYKNGTGRSKPGFSLGGTNLERHKFQLTVKVGASPEQTVIYATDHQRQQEEDMTPDSMYSWMEWHDRASQQGAADTFLQRLRLPIESALTARLIVSDQDIQIISSDDVITIEEANAAHETDTALISAPIIGQIQDIPEEINHVVPAKTKEKAIVTPPAGKDIKPLKTSKQPVHKPVRVTVPSVVPRKASETPNIVPAKKGLLVKAAPSVAWQALQQSLDDLDVERKHEDGQQYLLLTGWINADYDSKNQLLTLQSKGEPRWAFGLFGEKGAERHRFRIAVMPAVEGTQAIIYAYHTGFQEQVDQTPDSSQTILIWEDRDTSPAVAVALLRKLRIIIPR